MTDSVKLEALLETRFFIVGGWWLMVGHIQPSGAFLAINASDDLVAVAAFDRAFDELFDVGPEQPSRPVLALVELDNAQRPARSRQFERPRRNVEFARSGVEAH